MVPLPLWSAVGMDVNSFWRMRTASNAKQDPDNVWQSESDQRKEGRTSLGLEVQVPETIEKRAGSRFNELALLLLVVYSSRGLLESLNSHPCGVATRSICAELSCLPGRTCGNHKG